jgi:hypothetical protein
MTISFGSSKCGMKMAILTQPNISKSEDKEKLVIDITVDDHEWIARIGKTSNEICNDSA